MSGQAADNVRRLHPVDAPRGKVLRIVAGLHAGASRGLADQEMLVVGSGDDCDIVLADTGVAAHHALITLVGGTFTLRALDAPVRIEGKPLHPGDPVEVLALQRIDLGEAAIAFGNDDEASWDALFPAIADPARKRSARPLMRRLPLFAAGAVLVLAIVAVVAAFLPRRNAQIDAQAYLQSLIPTHAISKAKVGVDGNGVPVLSGTVESQAVRDRIQQQLADAGVQASLSLRTGEDLARDVREVFRMSGIGVQTRYLGDGKVEINGDVDEKKFKQVLQSRALAEVEVTAVPGDKLRPLVDDGENGAVAAAPQVTPVDIVKVVPGKVPYVVDNAGMQYPIGAEIPGHGKLIMIGRQITVQGADGAIKQVRPVTAAELAARASASDFNNVSNGTDAQASANLNAERPQRPINGGRENMPSPPPSTK